MYLTERGQYLILIVNKCNHVDVFCRFDINKHAVIKNLVLTLNRSDLLPFLPVI